MRLIVSVEISQYNLKLIIQYLSVIIMFYYITSRILLLKVQLNDCRFFETLSNFLKGNIGSGWLGLPFALMQAGTIVGTMSLLIISFMSLFCMHLLLQAKAYLSKKYGDRAWSYETVVCFYKYSIYIHTHTHTHTHTHIYIYIYI